MIGGKDSLFHSTNRATRNTVQLKIIIPHRILCDDETFSIFQMTL